MWLTNVIVNVIICNMDINYKKNVILIELSHILNSFFKRKQSRVS